jgi:hypothetical protein
MAVITLMPSVPTYMIPTDSGTTRCTPQRVWLIHNASAVHAATASRTIRNGNQ